MTVVSRLAFAIEPGQRFVSVAFHDVVDVPSELEDDSITTDRLIAFFDFLKGDGWTVLTLDDVAAAQRKEKLLPPKSVLITFDDGYQSLYSRVYPLALAYNYPIVAALVGEWMDAPASVLVTYAGKQVPRTKFLSWEAVREMQRSGLVEFASHTYSLHRDVLANPQGSRMPIAITQRYDERTHQYETASQHQQFLRDNFKRDRLVFQRELKRVPRAVVWPFGRYSNETLDIAKQAGYTFALTLEPEPSDAADLLRIARYLPTRDPKLGDEIEYLRFADRLPTVQRLACLDPAELTAESLQESDLKLGILIERARQLGLTQVVIPAAFMDQEQKIQSWFPTQTTGVKADRLSRLVWQMQTRAGVSPTLSVPLTAMQQSGMTSAEIQKWFEDLGRMVPVHSLMIRDLNNFGDKTPAPENVTIDGSWQIRENRNRLKLAELPEYERLALTGFKQVAAFRPSVQLFTFKNATLNIDQNVKQNIRISNAIDLTLFTTSLEKDAAEQTIKRMQQSGLLDSEASRRRVGLWIDDSLPPNPEKLKLTSQSFQAQKGTAFGWCPNLWLENQPDAAEIAPVISSARFPLKP